MTPFPSIDVVIPVYNAPALTKRCIDSVVTQFGSSIQTIHVQNDASDSETREMLDSLSYPQLQIFHAPENQGYGKSVNEAVARSTADLVFVLNSDTEIRENFLPALCAALAADPELAVISPTEVSPITGTTMESAAQRYLRRPGGYIATYRLRGYAFLMRRTLFHAVGGLDLQFGRGYYEDVDLGRRLIQQGWRLGEHPDAIIYHRTSASFGRGKSRRALVEKNRALYFSRYPQAKRNVLLVMGVNTLADLPVELVHEMERVFQQGGTVLCLSPQPLPQLYCLQMHNHQTNIAEVLKLILTHRLLRDDKRISSIWILPAISSTMRTILTIFSRCYRLQWRQWSI